MMLFLKIVFELFILYQITQIITESQLLEPIRSSFVYSKLWIFKKIGHLISCFLCSGVWVGFILSFRLFNFAEYLGYYELSWFWNGLFFSCLSWFLRMLEK